MIPVAAWFLALAALIAWTPAVDWGMPDGVGGWTGAACSLALVVAGLLYVPRATLLGRGNRRRRARWNTSADEEVPR